MAPIDDIAVLTSENVRLTYTLAGMGSRVAAFLADILIIVLLTLGITVIFALYGLTFRQIDGIGAGELSFIVALYITAITILHWGYYFFFEWMNWGQTPGKQLLGIRVSMADGAPADIVACSTRNVVRIVDLALAMVGITFFIMIFTPKYQRLGDLVSGTVVVKRRRLTFDEIMSASREADRHAAAVERSAALAGAPIRVRVDDAERALLQRFMERRDSLPLDVRRKLAADLARRIRSRAPGEAADRLGDEALIEATVGAAASKSL